MEIVMAIITSFFASVVFYICFQMIPEKKRYMAIRPRIEVELMEVTDSLFFYIELPFRYNMHFTSLFQKEIKQQLLSQKDFEIGLYNKCLNESYLFDENADKFMVVGTQLKKWSDQITSKIQQIMMNQQYLRTNEIIIIEDISRLLNVYLYDTNAFDKVGKIIVHPINPTISYMSENYYKLYSLWSELRQIMYQYKYIEKEKRQGQQRFFSLQLEHISYCIARNDYKTASILIENLDKDEKPEFDKTILDYLRLQLYISTGAIDKSRDQLTKILLDKKREKVIYQRGYLECIRDNKELLDLCSSLCSSDEIMEWNLCVQQESKTKEDFWNQNIQLKAYYSDKEKHTSQFG